MMRAAMHVARNASRRPGETNLLTICTSLSGELVESLFCESVESLLGESFESLSVDSLLRKWVANWLSSMAVNKAGMALRTGTALAAAAGDVHGRVPLSLATSASGPVA